MKENDSHLYAFIKNIVLFFLSTRNESTIVSGPSTARSMVAGGVPLSSSDDHTTTFYLDSHLATQRKEYAGKQNTDSHAVRTRIGASSFDPAKV